ncbi:NF-kappa-B inhibitor cactus [Pieris rapae]|uniref:NF-kappa-B inhibitor cactus n=1 Tax=Pieris rapae TaxID=64459 RepID=UPI001E280D1C|nr:NF-kappa-B inhibitor cactus [Pieris rapae]
MSAKKAVDTKIFDDENTDSGFLSGPLSEQNLTEEYNPDEDSKETHDAAIDTLERTSDKQEKRKDDCKDNKSSKDLLSQHEEFDSGVISMELKSGEVDCYETTSSHVPVEPLIVIEEFKGDNSVQAQKYDLPPIKILFEQDEDGDTQLHIAAVHGCATSVSTLIKICPEKKLLNIVNRYGHTALHLAVLAGQPHITKMLVEAGASISVRDFNGETPLHIAVQKKYMKTLKLLLEPLKRTPREYFNVLDQKNYNGQTCVHLAASKGYIDEIRLLVSCRANINAKEGLAGHTALHIATRRRDEDLMRYLLTETVADRGVRDYAGRTARHFARKTTVAHLFTDDYSDDDDYDSDSENESEVDRFEEMHQMMAACTTTCA